MKSTVLKFLAALGLVGSMNASATVMVYDVSDATQSNCVTGHGLWTNGNNHCSDNYYSFEQNGAGATLTIDDVLGTATLSGNAWNGTEWADIDLVYGAMLNHADFTSGGGTVKGAGNGDETTWLFFTSVSGTITLGGGSAYDVTGLAGNTGFQFGLGANDKNGEFGASSWITGSTIRDHWDLNLSLTEVPEPGSLALLGLGLIGLGFSRRRQQAS